MKMNAFFLEHEEVGTNDDDLGGLRGLRGLRGEEEERATAATRID